ncbi:MAG: aminotransferase class I/II-fold pyridoxal phosphate-dependent enzyme [Actinobacteria bacterium]|nr:aminotransferase class I/II-fold pyridoxal phosphate-dependent enzyme [Actinomycetota bacterium]
MALTALATADPSRYPDPAYTDVRERLAHLHRRDRADVVVGAGACELIHRAVRTTGGPLLLLEPTFGEYRYAAAVAGVTVRSARDLDAFGALLGVAKLAVLCVPSSPGGHVSGADVLRRLAAQAKTSGCRLLLDLAYHPLSQQRPPPPADSWQLWAPNKAHGVTGVRAGYVLAAPDDAARLRAAPSWVLSAHGVAFLACITDPAARRWVRTSRATLWRWRDELAAELRACEVPVETGRANYLLARVGDATATTRQLRLAGIGVRDATSFGRPDALRLSAQPPESQAVLRTALRAIRA